MMFQTQQGAAAALAFLEVISKPDEAKELLTQLKQAATDAISANEALNRKAGELAASAAQVQAAADQLKRDRATHDQRVQNTGNASIAAAQALASDRASFEAERADALNKISVANEQMKGRTATLEQRERAVEATAADQATRETELAAKEKRVEDMRAEYTSMLAKLQAIITPAAPPDGDHL
jgi:chromosome segregation ATPase